MTDMALDALERQSLDSLADVKKLQCGIVRKMVKVRDEELARRTGKPKGIYLTYDCPPAALSSEKGFRALAGYIAGALVEDVLQIDFGGRGEAFASRLVSEIARKAALLGPPAVAVHDESNMDREFVPIDWKIHHAVDYTLSIRPLHRRLRRELTGGSHPPLRLSWGACRT